MSNKSVKELTDLIETRNTIKRMIREEKANGRLYSGMASFSTMFGSKIPAGLKVLNKVGERVHTASLAILEEEMKELEVTIASYEAVFSKAGNTEGAK